MTLPEIDELIEGKEIHVIVGGPPCQGFSMAGPRDRKDPRNSLFMDYVRVVNHLKPSYFVLENVRGLLSMKTAKGEDVIEIIRKEFKKIHYNIDWKVLNSADYGVPQKRHRVIVLGAIEGKEIPPYPNKTHTKNPDESNLFDNTIPWVGVGEVLLDKKDVPESYFHSDRMIEGFIRRKEFNLKKGNGFGAQYLSLDKPSYTISARYWKDGADALVKYSETEIRMLTLLEAARIQTFPDDYKFTGSKRDVYTQIGNAVPCLMAKAIALEIFKMLIKNNVITNKEHLLTI